MKKIEIKFIEEKDPENFDSHQDFQELLANANKLQARAQLAKRVTVSLLFLVLPVILTLGYFKRNEIVSFFSGKEPSKEVKHIISNKNNSIPENQEELPVEVVPVEKDSVIATPNEVGFEELHETKKDVIVKAHPLIVGDSLVNYLNNAIRFTSNDLEKSVVSETAIMFWVNKNGRPEEITFIDPLHESLKAKVINAILNMPNWAPATINGEPYRSRVGFKIIFQLEDFPQKELEQNLVK